MLRGHYYSATINEWWLHCCTTRFYCIPGRVTNEQLQFTVKELLGREGTARLDSPRIAKVGGVAERGKLKRAQHSQNGIGEKCTAGSAEQEYRSSYDNGIGKSSTWANVSNDPLQVHLLARIFLGSVCLIWSGLSQLGFLTGKSGGDNRWSQDEKLHAGDHGLGSFMAAMGYDLERLNQGTGK